MTNLDKYHILINEVHVGWGGGGVPYRDTLPSVKALEGGPVASGVDARPFSVQPLGNLLQLGLRINFEACKE